MRPKKVGWYDSFIKEGKKEMSSTKLPSKDGDDAKVPPPFPSRWCDRSSDTKVRNTNPKPRLPDVISGLTCPSKGTWWMNCEESLPILPDLLNTAEDNINTNGVGIKNATKSILPIRLLYSSTESQMSTETKKAAVLLACKSIIQLAANSPVAIFVSKVGYYSSLLTGNLILLITSLLFGYGTSFPVLTIARSLHGIASVLITVSGMCICAEIYSNDEKLRSKFMGIILGSEALGILFGFTIGTIVYNFYGKLIPFVVIATIVTINIEACLPFWLIQNFNIEKWQQGLIFLPDSFGYLVSTSILGTLFRQLGNWKSTVIALSLVGINLIIIPNTSSLLQLSVPHFTIGLGIGTVNSNLIPILADYADTRKNTRYISVYALQQGISSLAYICGSLSAGELIQITKFSNIIKTIGILNITYAAIFYLFETKYSIKIIGISNNDLQNLDDFSQQIELISMKQYNYYSLYNSEESD
ncbi:hypothetical protein PGB90_009830 [Kerria lacca]